MRGTSTCYYGTEILIIGLVAMAASAAITGVSAYQSAQTAKHNAKVTQRNNEIAAEHAEKSAKAAEYAQRKKDEALMNSFAAKAAGQGVVAREGSPLLAEIEFAQQSKMEEKRAGYAAQIQAHQQAYAGKLAGWQAAEINPTRSAAMAGGSQALSSGSSLATGLA